MNQEGWLNGTLTQEQLKQRLSYDPETGIFRWIGRRDGEIAGFKGNRGYVNITLGRKCYRAHRLAWLYVHGEWPKELIDHINGVRDDNRLSNLRDVTNAVNQQNQQQAQSHNKVGLLGVHWNKKRDKFEATIRVKGKNIFIGRYDDPNEAHAAYLAKKREIHEGAMGAIPHAANCPALEGLPCVCSMPSVPESLGLALTRARVPHAYWRPLINELLPLMQKPTKPEPASEQATWQVEDVRTVNGQDL